MAKVKITGHASGTGILTVTAPNTSTDRTITLPDATGTLLNSDGSGASLTALNATNLGSGTVPTARLGSGTASSSTYLRGDNTWATVSTFDPDAAVVFNESGADVDFRVESDDNANMIFVDGGNDAVGIGTATPNTVGSATGLTGNNLKVGSTSASSRIILEGAATADLHMADLSGTANERQFRLRADGSTWTFAAYSDNFSSSTELLKLTHGGLGLSQFTAKAWIKFSGTGTISIDDSHNVGSITDNGTGRYRVTYSNSVSDGSYCAIANCPPDNNAGAYGGVNAYAAGTCDVDFRKASTDLAHDVNHINVLVFAD